VGRDHSHVLYTKSSRSIATVKRLGVGDGCGDRRVNGINSYNKTDEHSELSASSEPLTCSPPRLVPSHRDSITAALLPVDKRAPSDYIVSLDRTTNHDADWHTTSTTRTALLSRAQTTTMLYDTDLSPPEIIDINHNSNNNNNIGYRFV